MMYGSNDGGPLVEMREALFDRELDLQKFLTGHQGLLAGDQMNPTDPRRFVLVSAEMGIAISHEGGNYFSLDHLFIDQDGIPTLVEVKRSQDTRLRREVVGQMLDYAANAVTFWTGDRLRLIFERRCESHKLNAITELRKLDNIDEADPVDIWEKVQSNLVAGRLRLVFIADKFSAETQRIIEFMSRQMSLTEVYAVEVRQFVGVGMKMLVPRVLNSSIVQSDRRVATSASGEMWTEERFFSALQEHSGHEAVRVFREIYVWANEQPRLRVFFGRGKVMGSIQVAYTSSDRGPSNARTDTVILSLWTYGTVEIEFQYLMTTKAFASEEARMSLRSQLISGSTLVLPSERISQRPNIKWSDFANPLNLGALFSTVSWIVARLNATNDETDLSRI